MTLPTTQKVVHVSKQSDDLDVIVDATEPIPELQAGDVLIKIEWAGVNFIDTYLRSGLYPRPTPFTLGDELAGTVAAVGEGSSFKVGDRVAAYVDKGGYAQYIHITGDKADHVVARLPDGVDTKTAAATLVSGLTALTNVTESYNVQNGDWILVPAAAGGLGTLITQLAVSRGAHVIGTVSSEEKAKHAREAGAEHVLISTTPGIDIPAEVAKLTKGQGVQAVFDGVGKATFEDALKSVARKGTVVSIGNASGAVPPFSLFKLTEKNIKVGRPKLGNSVATPEEWQHYTKELYDLLAKGVLKQSIYKVYPFSAEGIRQTQIDITSRKTIGKLLVHVS